MEYTKETFKKKLEKLEKYVKYNPNITGYENGVLDTLKSLKKLILSDDMQHRELLIAYEKYHYTPQEWALASKQCIEDIDNFLAINCT